jgi:hypothetical protein
MCLDFFDPAKISMPPAISTSSATHLVPEIFRAALGFG